MRDLLADYLACHDDLSGFFGQPLAALFAVAPDGGPWEGSLVEAIRAYQLRLDYATEVPKRGAVIVTGQQPGLFTGPLYTVYKAVTAIRLAKRVEAVSGRPCTPVFWIGSDDHDFEEARTAHFLSKTQTPFSLRYTPAQDVSGLPMYRVPVEQSLHDLIDSASGQTSGSEFRDEIAAALHETLEASESLADWTARLLARLFRGTNLVLFAPHLDAARMLAKPILEREISAPLVSTRLLNEAGAQLGARGYTQQITKAETECAFFLEVDSRRCKVLYEKDRYRLPETAQEYSVKEMLETLNRSPERFSPNVALRCVVQQRLFPVTAYVAGPGELAYWAQLRPVFDHFGLAMPIVYPRANCTLTTTKLKKLTSKFGFTQADFQSPPENLLDQALQAATDTAALTLVRDRRAEIERLVQALVDEAAPLHPAAKTLTEGLLRRISSELDRLESGLLHADTQQTEAVRKQVQRLCNVLAPWRKPQERVYTVFSFLFEQGWALIPRLLRELDVESFHWNEVEL